MKNIALLGASGSIGTSTLEVIRRKDIVLGWKYSKEVEITSEMVTGYDKDTLGKQTITKQFQ